MVMNPPVEEPPEPDAADDPEEAPAPPDPPDRPEPPPAELLEPEPDELDDDPLDDPPTVPLIAMTVPLNGAVSLVPSSWRSALLYDAFACT